VVECVVPRVVGLALADAKTLIRSSHCTVGVVTRKYGSVKKGHVVTQSPRGGRHFPSGSTVDLVVSRGRRPRSAGRIAT
jgi:serine/threonine-protein kinase